MTDGRLAGLKVAFLATNGFEDSELTSPWQAVERAGAHAVLVSPESGIITGKKGHRATVDVPLDIASPTMFDALVLPGGKENASRLRGNERAAAFTRDFFEHDKTVAVICHGGWILADSGLVKGRRMTSYPSLEGDLRKAGADWVDEEVVVDGALVSSRRPGDLAAFDKALVTNIATR